MEIKRLIISIASAVSLTACASIVSDNESTTYIETEPETARCELHGQDFKRVVNTPDSIHLPAEAAPITIACVADGYKTTTEPLDTKVDGWVFGNILFGGLIGLAIDSARGAGQEYPPHVMVALEPEIFTSQADRDAWYDRRREAQEARWNNVISQAQAQCSDDDDTSCKSRVEKAQEERDEEIAELEERRLQARVAQAP